MIDRSAVRDMPTDDRTTMTAMIDAGTDMIGIILWSMTGEGTIRMKGTRISNEIRSEDFSVEKSVGRQREITTQRRHRKTEKQKTPIG